MAEAVIDGLLEFAETRLLPKSTGLSVEWFGGEPLLGMAVIERLSAEFREICGRRQQGYTAGVTTNGYLLDRVAAERLIAIGVTSAQVTLDGPAEIHNRRRPTAGGRGSFERILDNLREIPKQLEVSIRINVDARNQAQVFSLLSFLAREGIAHKAKPYVARVEEFSEECSSSAGSILSSAEFEQFKRELKDRCLNEGVPWFSDSPPRQIASGFCIVDTRKGFVVLPDGRLLKCWAEAGNRLASPVAHLLKRETWLRPLMSPLQVRNPFDDVECRACKILPACMGGCPRLRANLRRKGITLCPPVRYSLADEVHTVFLRQTKALRS